MIKAGDMVQVVRKKRCCGQDGDIGRVFTVASTGAGGYCMHCGMISIEQVAMTGDHHESGIPFCVQVSRLIKIDPPPLPETIKKPEEMTI